MTDFLRRYLPAWAADDGGGGGAGAGGQGAAAGGTAAAAGGTAAAPWHAGIEAETLGFWQNKGLDLSDPKAFATALTKQYREAEKYIGAPPDQLLKMPKPDAKPDEWKAFHQRLGAPADAKEYDLSGVKLNGSDLDAGFADAMRAALAAAYVPKERAGGIVKAFVDYLEGAEKSESALTTAKIAEEKTSLRKNWGSDFDYNHLKAMEGARKLGITPEAVQALENQVGYASVMEAMRRIGQSVSEDILVDSPRGGGPGRVTTRDGAQARLAQLTSDPAWGRRFVAGDVEAKTEFVALTTLIDGEAA